MQAIYASEKKSDFLGCFPLNDGNLHMPVYKKLFFDLDHTLWDFEKNSRETLEELFYENTLDKHQLFDFDTFEIAYSQLNRQLWDLYNHNKITKQELRDRRFKDTFIQLGLEEKFHPADISRHYLERCPDKPHLFPGALEVLEDLYGQYPMSIITNGFPEAQFRKLQASGLEKFFDQVHISEHIGIAKPHPGIFEHALKHAGFSSSESLMIGDNLDTDIHGASRAGIDAVWFNPDHLEAEHAAVHVVHHLAEIPSFLRG